MFGRRRVASDRDLATETAADVAAEGAGADEGATGAAPAAGPWDMAEPHPDLPRVDLGSLQVPVLDGMDIQLVFAEQHGAWVTVRHGLSELQLQAFAAPKRDSLWDDVRAEIAAETPAAAAPLEALLREVVVVRGDHPVPPRDLLELRLPPEAAAALEEQARAQQENQQENQQDNRFAIPPNPFERGPEFTETR